MEDGTQSPKTGIHTLLSAHKQHCNAVHVGMLPKLYLPYVNQGPTFLSQN